MSGPIVLPPGSGPTGPPANVPQSRPRRIGDAVGSIIVLVAAMGAYFIGLLLSVATLSVSSTCNTCQIERAVGAQSATAVVLAILLLVGAVVTLVFLFALRRRAWPIALATLLLILVGWVVGAIVFYVTLTA